MILRKLEDGWEYSLAWRCAAVEPLLSKWRMSTSLSQLVHEEKDPFVRQDLLFRAGGRCVDPEAFAFAHRCQENPRSAAAVIRAMAAAGCASQKISDYVGTAQRNVTAYLKLFFDISRYVENRAWLHTIVFSQASPGTAAPGLLRERLMMAAAYHGGWKQLERMLTGTPPTTSVEIQEMAEAIKAAVAFRAFQYVTGMGGVPPGPEDFDRHVDLMRMPAQVDLADQETKTAAFMNGLIEIIHKKAEADPSNPKYATILESVKDASSPELVALPAPAAGA